MNLILMNENLKAKFNQELIPDTDIGEWRPQAGPLAGKPIKSGLFCDVE
jgi:hypothetical protein